MVTHAHCIGNCRLERRALRGGAKLAIKRKLPTVPLLYVSGPRLTKILTRRWHLALLSICWLSEEAQEASAAHEEPANSVQRSL